MDAPIGGGRCASRRVEPPPGPWHAMAYCSPLGGGVAVLPLNSFSVARIWGDETAPTDSQFEILMLMLS